MGQSINVSDCSLMTNAVMENDENNGVLVEQINGSSSQRRVSSRLSGKKRPYYGTTNSPISNTKSTNWRIRVSNNDNKLSYPKTKGKLLHLMEQEQEEKVTTTTIVECSEKVKSTGVEGECVLNQVLGEVTTTMSYGNVPDFVPNLEGKSAHQRVKETIRVFNKYYLQLIQEEEQRCRKVDDKVKNSRNSPKSKKGTSREEDTKIMKKISKQKREEEDTKRSAKRPDLKAITKMINTKAILYATKRFGALPGVDAGHQFYSRAEMVVVGLHSHWLNGIDFMGVAYSKLEEYKSYVFPLATSIVLSGVYEDDLDNSEDVVYTGQGGNNLQGDKRQVSDQVMLRGNLALKNNMEQSVPVRVIRGLACASSYTGKVYTYDGLYKVVQYWAEKGVSGFTVFKYRLRRIEGQPALTTSQVQYIRAQAPRSLSELRGLVCNDISGGQETLPVPASNLVDDPPVAPTGYTYCKSLQVAEGVTFPTIDSGCNCDGACIDPRICACAKLNGSGFPYVGKDGGRLIEAKSVVFECGPNCRCGSGCVNRTSQHGLKYRLEVYRTPNKGWAVRSWDFIPSGAPICEYTGKLMRTCDIDNVSGNDFIFDIDCLQTMEGLDGRESRPGVVSILTSSHMDTKVDEKKTESVPEFCIDAGTMGGVARFINHSCEPNLFVQCVLSFHHDIKLAKVMLFAADNIPPLQELTYDYGYALDSVMDADGNIKVLPCHCGAKDCRKRLY